MVLILGVLAFVVYLANKAMTDLKANSDSLRSMAIEKKRLAMIAERTSNAVIITDIKGSIQWVNQALHGLPITTLEEATGKKPGELLQFEKTDPRTVELLRQAIRARQPIKLSNSKQIQVWTCTGSTLVFSRCRRVRQREWFHGS